MHKLVQQVSTCIEREKLAQSGQTIYVAVSGGADSVALLTALYMLDLYNLHVVHCNFSLRADDSNADEVFVQQYAQRLQLPFSRRKYDTEAYSKEKKVSIEMAARELRYSWFYEILQDNPDSAIAIAHNMNDNVETLLYNLAQGTGIRGLAGMPYKRNNDGIIRPMLDVSKDDILDFLETNPIINTWREDKSNVDTRYRRNYIRHKLLPCFNELKQKAVQQINLSLQQLRGAETFYRIAIESAKKEVFENNQIDIKKLLSTPSPSTLLFEILSSYNFSSAQCYEILSKLNTISSGATFLSSSHKLIRSWAFLELIQLQDKNENIVTTLEVTVSNLPKEYTLPNGEKLQVYSAPLNQKHLKNPNSLVLEKEKIYGKTFLYRPIQEGDRIQAFGMAGKKLISRILIDKKVPHSKRLKAGVITLNDEIFWLIGYSKSELTRIKLEEKTEYIIIEYREN